MVNKIFLVNNYISNSYQVDLSHITRMLSKSDIYASNILNFNNLKELIIKDLKIINFLQNLKKFFNKTYLIIV